MHPVAIKALTVGTPEVHDDLDDEDSNVLFSDLANNNVEIDESDFTHCELCNKKAARASLRIWMDDNEQWHAFHTNCAINYQPQESETDEKVLEMYNNLKELITQHNKKINRYRSMAKDIRKFQRANDKKPRKAVKGKKKKVVKPKVKTNKADIGKGRVLDLGAVSEEE